MALSSVQVKRISKPSTVHSSLAEGSGRSSAQVSGDKISEEDKCSDNSFIWVCTTNSSSAQINKCKEQVSNSSEQLTPTNSSEQLSTTKTQSKEVDNWRNQLEIWRKQYSPWLYINGNKIGCTACRNVKRMCTNKKGVQVAEEWALGRVQAMNVRAMRKKIYKHRDSQAHQRALEIEAQKEKVLPKLTEKVTQIAN